MARRILSLYLCLLMVLSMIPVQAFAQTTDTKCANHPEHIDCGYVPATEDTDCDHSCSESCIMAPVTSCIHNHEALGCSWIEETPAVYCGHNCADGTCGLTAAQEEDRTSSASCDFVHTDCGCAAAVPAHWNCGHVCTEENSCVKQVCNHTCTDGTCSFVQGSAGSACTHKCELCSPVQPAAKSIEAWTWLDPEEYLTKGELSIPGANAEQVVTYEMILSFLPTAIVAEGHGQVPVTFSCDAYPAAGAYSGIYTFTAALPEGYVLAENANTLTVPVSLGNTDNLWNDHSMVSGVWRYGNYFSGPSGDGAVIEGYTGTSNSVTIPSSLGGLPVEAIGIYSFGEYSGPYPKSVTIPSRIVEIQGSAFRSSTALQSVTIKGSPRCGSWAFYNCSSLATVNLGSITQIPELMFGGCSSLKNITLPSTITTIGDSAFAGCPLQSITIPSSVSTIEKYAFNGSEFTEITIPDHTNLQSGALAGCKNLQKINASDDSYYSSVDGVLYNFTESDLVAYPRAKKGSSYIIPNGVKKVKSYAFSGYATSDIIGTLTNLRTLYVPYTVTSLEEDAFMNNSISAYYFCGDAPSYTDSPFWTTNSVTVYYAEGREGWGSTYGGKRTAVWPAEDHATEERGTYPATCGEPAYTLMGCPRCDFTYKKPIEGSQATGNHSWNFTADDEKDIINVSCSGCKTSGTVSLLGPTDCTYNGSPITASVENTVSDLESPAITYTGEKVTQEGHAIAVGSYSASITLGNASVSLNFAISLRQEAVPTASVDYPGEQLTGLIPDGTYTINTETVTADALGTVTIAESWIGTEISVVKLAENNNYADSAAQLLTLPGRPAAPTSVQAEGETTAGANDGKITGLTADMEYRKAGDSDWAAVSGTEATGLAAGSYEVRIKATETSFASDAIELTVADGTVEVTSITLDQTNTRLNWKKKVTLKATVYPENATDKTLVWTSSDERYATVDQNGVVTGSKNHLGTVTITATASNGVSASCTVFVYKGYTVWVDGIEVAHDNYTDVLGDGTVSFDVITRTLTLNGLNLTTSGTYGIRAEPGLNLVLAEGSENVIDCTNSSSNYAHGISTAGTLVVTGGGSLKVKSKANSYSMYTGVNMTGGTLYTEGSWHSVPVILRDATVYADDSVDLYWNDGLELHGNTHLVIRDDTCVSNATRLTTDAKNYYWRSSPDGAFTAGGAPDYTKTYFEFITESHLGFADDQNNTTHSYGCADTTCINALRGQKENHVWSYSAEDNVLTEECSHCTASGTAELTAPENLSYSGTAKKAVLSKAGTLSDRELSVVYGPDELLTDGLPVNAGTYTASVTMTGADGAEAVAALTYSIEKATREPADFTFTPPEAPEYDGTAKKPAITLPEGLDPDDVTITITDAQGNEVSEPKDVGDYKVTVSVKGDANHEAVEGLTSDDWTFTIQPAVVTVSIAPIPKQLYTGKAVEPSIDVTFSGLVTGETLTEDVDYTVTYADNIHTGTASVQIEDVAGGNYMVTSDTASFTISYGVKLEGHSTATDSAVVCVDGISTSLDNGILWLDNTDARMVTTYTYHNAGAQDMHTVYPTGVFVWQLTFSEETGYTAERLAELDDIMKYAGTSIRITGNQGIRFITSVPEAKKQALTGAGLAGYQLVEYGTLMGWYRSGTDLLYGVNAKSVAYDRSSNTDSVFNRADGMVQFTGMLTNLELDQSTKDLVTRPYMVLERTNEAGETEQVVLYGGSLVRSIGYVAYQNKDVYSPGAAAYEFIWNILSYAYPDLYEAEYGK